jgi:amiloride-sensitive sodium channel subunit alpha
MNEPKNTKNESPSLLATFKLIIIEGFLSTTTHALPNIFRTGNAILKITWLCCFLACGSYGISSMVKTIQDYLTYPSYIATEIVRENPTQFPAISICNLKTINKKKYYNYVDSNTNMINPSFYATPYDYINAVLYYTRTAIGVDTNLTETTRKDMGYEMKDMLISCLFNYDSCSVNDFTYFYDPIYGNCYTFNKGVDDNGTLNEIRKVSTSNGAYSGLILEIFVGDPKIESYFEFNDGVLISIHNQSTKPFSQGDKIKAAAGAETDLILSRNFITKLESPHGDCLKDKTNSSKFTSFYFDYIVKTLGVDYSHEYCFNLCLQTQIINACNCSNTLMPSFRNTTKYCKDYTTEILCMTDVVKKVNKTFALECEIACPVECDSIEYEVTTYRALYPNYYYTQILSAAAAAKGINISDADIDKAVAKVNIFYKNMEYKTTTQKIQTTTEDLFSNIGGTLGLCIGISILSLVEVFELGFKLVLALIVHLKSRKQIQSDVKEVII